MQVTDRFKGLDLTERVPEELWTGVHDIVREAGSRPSPGKRNAKRQNGCLRTTICKQLRKEKKRKAKEKRKDISECRVPKNSKES